LPTIEPGYAHVQVTPHPPLPSDSMTGGMGLGGMTGDAMTDDAPHRQREGAAICITDAEGNIIDANLSFYTMTGCRDDTEEPASIGDFLLEVNRPRDAGELSYTTMLIPLQGKQREVMVNCQVFASMFRQDRRHGEKYPGGNPPGNTDISSGNTNDRYMYLIKASKTSKASRRNGAAGNGTVRSSFQDHLPGDGAVLELDFPGRVGIPPIPGKTHTATMENMEEKNIERAERTQENEA